MLGFFRNIFKRLRNTLNQDRYHECYNELINMFRRVTVLQIEDIDNIHTILRTIVENPHTLDRKMQLLKNAMRNKAMTRGKYTEYIKEELRKPSGKFSVSERDVSYCIGGEVVYGEVSSEEEHDYFTRENIVTLNTMPFKPKKCDFGCEYRLADGNEYTVECQACVEKRLRNEITKKIEAENKKITSARAKRRRTIQNTAGELNEKFGVPKIFARYISDDTFRTEELDEEDQVEFERWKVSQEKCAEEARKTLNLSTSFQSNISPANLTIPSIHSMAPITHSDNLPFTVTLQQDETSSGTEKNSQPSGFINLFTPNTQSIFQNKSTSNPAMPVVSENPITNPFVQKADTSEQKIEVFKENPFERKADVLKVNPFEQKTDTSEYNPFAQKVHTSEQEKFDVQKADIPEINPFASKTNPFIQLSSQNSAGDSYKTSGNAFTNPFTKVSQENNTSTANIFKTIENPFLKEMSIPKMPEGIKNPFSKSPQFPEMPSNTNLSSFSTPGISNPTSFNPFAIQNNTQIPQSTPDTMPSSFSSINIFQGAREQNNQEANLFMSGNDNENDNPVRKRKAFRKK